MKKKTLLITPFLLLLLKSCDWGNTSACDIKRACDLVIPTIVELYNQYGQPIIDYQGNQAKGHNELYYNERTGEWFNKEYPPQLGLIVGDIIQVGTQVFNNYINDACEKSQDAGSSSTQPIANVQLQNGQQANINLETFMPTGPILQGENRWTATKFQFYGSGYYNFNFNANYDEKLDELNFNNNKYKSNGSNYGKNSLPWLFVKGDNSSEQIIKIKDYVKSYQAPKTQEDLKQMELIKFVKSENYTNWIKSKMKQIAQ